MRTWILWQKNSRINLSILRISKEGAGSSPFWTTTFRLRTFQVKCWSRKCVQYDAEQNEDTSTITSKNTIKWYIEDTETTSGANARIYGSRTECASLLSFCTSILQMDILAFERCSKSTHCVVRTPLKRCFWRKRNKGSFQEVPCSC